VLGFKPRLVCVRVRVNRLGHHVLCCLHTSHVFSGAMLLAGLAGW
jgi:hypothetical protein